MREEQKLLFILFLFILSFLSPSLLLHKIQDRGIIIPDVCPYGVFHHRSTSADMFPVAQSQSCARATYVWRKCTYDIHYVYIYRVLYLVTGCEREWHVTILAKRHQPKGERTERRRLLCISREALHPVPFLQSYPKPDKDCEKCGMSPISYV